MSKDARHYIPGLMRAAFRLQIVMSVLPKHARGSRVLGVGPDEGVPARAHRRCFNVPAAAVQTGRLLIQIEPAHAVGGLGSGAVQCADPANRHRLDGGPCLVPMPGSGMLELIGRR